jgi:phage baseplate assembly protein W
MNINFPFRFDSKGRTATASEDKHIRDLIEQVLFTTPGERVNRPTLGSGLMQLVFEPNSNELAATVQFLVQGALQQWLGELIVVDNVDVQNPESLLQVTVVYTVRRTEEKKVAIFEKAS